MKRALILGGAQCVHEDIVDAKALFTPDVIIAVNDIGVGYPHIDHWVSFHPYKFGQWLKRRARAGLELPKDIWSHHRTAVDQGKPVRVLTGPHWGGSSGLLAVQVAIEELKIDRIVIAGIPMTETPHFDRKPDKPWPEAMYYRAKWEERTDLLKRYVRSMSGWTKEILGAPDRAWLGVEELVA